ncbi:DUF3168 domain-containing protein [Larkinella soli]|uniref:DUF3168 domain-containing protein n=1 Tax=Larkinella soli TaxID=1770527 RepID=UPI000FFC3DF1|nr:DUF3168 domain-containing protein [Larkinella soli]
MIDTATALRTAYVQCLSGLTVNGTAVKVYDTQAPDTAADPKLVITSVTATGDNTKTTFGQEVELNLSAVTTGAGNQIGFKRSEDVLNAALDRILPAPGEHGLPQQPGLNIYGVSLVTTFPLSAASGGVILYQRIATLRHLIHETT